jgi:hypothetical protein
MVIDCLTGAVSPSHPTVPYLEDLVVPGGTDRWCLVARIGGARGHNELCPRATPWATPWAHGVRVETSCALGLVRALCPRKHHVSAGNTMVKPSGTLVFRASMHGCDDQRRTTLIGLGSLGLITAG